VTRVVAAAVQMTSTADVGRNFATAERLVREAASSGATLVGLPENFGHLRSEGEPGPAAQTMDGPWVSRMSALARELGITLLLGSLPEKPDEADGVDDTRVFNTSVLLGPTGKVLAKYRKLHLFDIEIPGMEHLKESRSVRPGGELAVADTPAGRIGLSICYDLRFPELYRRLGLRKPQILAVPSAFTERTGRDHWEVLLRARAIENLCYVLAPAQVGHHGAGRASWGHAAIIDPWGTVVAQVPEGEGFAMAPFDFELQARLRRELPALSHIRLH
jgi:deaminated glutathione amidase